VPRTAIRPAFRAGTTIADQERMAALRSHIARSRASWSSLEATFGPSAQQPRDATVMTTAAMLAAEPAGIDGTLTETDANRRCSSSRRLVRHRRKAPRRVQIVTLQPHAHAAMTVAAELAVDPTVGLTSDEVERRGVASGPNALEASKREPLWRLLVKSATEPFVLMLAAAGGLAILVGEARDGILVLFGLLPIVGADVVTEYRGERALEALRDATAPVARVRRGGAVTSVAAASLVPGDIVLLQGGDVVPADIRLSRADRLLVDRSVLTGESLP